VPYKRDGTPRDIPNKNPDPVPFYGVPRDGGEAVPPVPWDPIGQSTGHCVSFIQNNIKTVDMLPNLPSEIDIVLLRPLIE
jgi:hypothetical protein